MNTRNPSHPKVLLADDDCSVLEALGAALESEGFSVIRAADGHAAVENFKDHLPELVLLDVNMPVKGGWDTFARLKAINPLLPIIIITARYDAFSKAAAAGVTLMRKPLDIPHLLAAMRGLLAGPVEQRPGLTTRRESSTVKGVTTA